MCTWYSKKTREQMSTFGYVDSSNNETSYNPSQRPPMLIDLERILVLHILRAQNIGFPMRETAVRVTALRFHDRLKLLNIYNENGTRKESFKKLNQYIYRHDFKG